MAVPTGIESVLLGVTDLCFSLLNYGTITTEIGARLSASPRFWVYLIGIGSGDRIRTYENAGVKFQSLFRLATPLYRAVLNCIELIHTKGIRLNL